MNDSTSQDRINNDAPNSDEVTAKRSSHLFTVRIWPEVSDQGVVTWRGKVHHVPNGAWRYFHDGETLTAFLQTQVEAFVRETQHSRS